MRGSLFVEDIWDGIAEMLEKLPLTEAQKVELDQRLNSYRLNPEEGRSWEYVREAIRQSCSEHRRDHES